MIILAEIAYENDEDFRKNLPLHFHVTCVSMDSSEDIELFQRLPWAMGTCAFSTGNLCFDVTLPSYSLGPTPFSKAYAQLHPTSHSGVERYLWTIWPEFLCTEWFPKHSSLAFGHLLRLLDRVQVYYQHVILLTLKALQQTPVDAAQSPHVFAIVSQLVVSMLCWEALSVLEVLFQSCIGSSGVHMGELGFGDINGFGMEKALQAMLVPHNSFKARSGPLQCMAGGLGGQGDGVEVGTVADCQRERWDFRTLG